MNESRQSLSFMGVSVPFSFTSAKCDVSRDAGVALLNDAANSKARGKPAANMNSVNESKVKRRPGADALHSGKGAERCQGGGSHRRRCSGPVRTSSVCKKLFPGHYPCQSEDHARFAEAEPIPGLQSEAVSAAAKQHGVVVIGSFFERRAPGLYHNTAVVFDTDGSTAGVFRKMHNPGRSVLLREVLLHAGRPRLQGDRHAVRPDRVCVCWDQWYPEAARLTALSGARILFYPTAIAGRLPRRHNTVRASTTPGKR